jgi:hypothetical protein
MHIKQRGENMKLVSLKSIVAFILIFVAAPGLAKPAFAQGGTPIRTNTRILYHGGPVMLGTPRIYIVFYGNWTGNNAPALVADFAAGVSDPPYLRINAGYPDVNGDRPSGSVVYAGSVSDPSYSRGPTLTPQDIQGIVSDKITSGELPLDTTGIYLVIASADVTDIRADGTMSCTTGAPPLHGLGTYDGAYFEYGFILSPDRCPTIGAPQFVAPDGSLLPTPNGNFAADGMANIMARLLNVMITNPVGKDLPPVGSWYDRYGLENSDKCVGKFGTTYTTANGARANFRAGAKDYLIQQNWVNDRKGYCSLVP